MASRVAFLIDIVDSFGERELCLHLAAHLPAGVEAVFVAAPPVVAHVAGRFAARAYFRPAEALVHLAELAPALVVCSEIFNFPPELREGLAESRYALATTDGTGMGEAINANPFLQPGPGPRLPLPARLVRLIACPVSDPAPDTELAVHYALFGELQRGDRVAARRRFGAGGRLAMIALSPWALAAAARLGRNAHYDQLFAAIIAALAPAGEVTLVVVAHVPRPERRFGPVTVRTIRYLAAADYAELLLGCDLVISDNIIQTSIAKAFMAGVPTMVLVEKETNIFPLKLRMPDGAYTRALAPVQLDDAAAARARVAAAFAGEADGEAARAYRAAVAGLVDTRTIFAGLLAR